MDIFLNRFLSPGFPSPPSVQSPVVLMGPSWALGKPRTRLSLVCLSGACPNTVCVPDKMSVILQHCVLQVLTPEQQRAFCRIGALIRGFLTRRLLKTEKVKHLSQTVVVSSLFKMDNLKIQQAGIKVWILVFRIHGSSSEHSRPKLRTEAPTRHKITPCTSGSEPRWECQQPQTAELCHSPGL